MTEKNYTSLSKGLSWLLRHGATKHKLKMSADGYVLLNDVFNIKNFESYTFDDIKYVVEINDKQRFALKETNNKWYIRANQGHSHEVAGNIDQNKLLTKLTAPLNNVVHGTTYKNYQIIKVSGLKKMDRSHIHFSISDDIIEGNKQQSGIRYNAEVLIYLNMELAMKDGIEFYISQNKVVLSEGVGIEGIIDNKYFSKVIDRKTLKTI